MIDVEFLNRLVEEHVFKTDLTILEKHEWARDGDGYDETDVGDYHSARHCNRCGEVWIHCCNEIEPVDCAKRPRSFADADYAAWSLFDRAIDEGRTPEIRARLNIGGTKEYTCEMWGETRLITEVAATLPLAITMTYLRAVGAPLP